MQPRPVRAPHFYFSLICLQSFSSCCLVQDLLLGVEPVMFVPQDGIGGRRLPAVQQQLDLLKPDEVKLSSCDICEADGVG